MLHILQLFLICPNLDREDEIICSRKGLAVKFRSKLINLLVLCETGSQTPSVQDALRTVVGFPRMFYPTQLQLQFLSESFLRDPLRKDAPNNNDN
jgi:hypothetical protein